MLHNQSIVKNSQKIVKMIIFSKNLLYENRSQYSPQTIIIYHFHITIACYTQQSSYCTNRR
jgi:hypothetical protein